MCSTELKSPSSAKIENYEIIKHLPVTYLELTLNLKACKKASGVKRCRQSPSPDISFDLQIELISCVLLLQTTWITCIELYTKLKDRHRARRAVLLFFLPLLTNVFVGIQPPLKIAANVLIRKCSTFDCTLR